jgi:NhaP-type Na+/H+ or K+/H+ antiporter
MTRGSYVDFNSDATSNIGVVLTIVITGIAVNDVFQDPFIDALLLGAILASTDPVAVCVIFKKDSNSTYVEYYY